MGYSTSTSLSLNVHIPTYNFDNKFVFLVNDRMIHSKQVAMEDSSSIYIWKEKYELKEKDIVECMKKTAVLE